MPTTLSESGDRSPRGFGYANTGTGNKGHGAKDYALVQQGPGDNTAQTEQARKSFMDMRSSKLITEHERGYAQSNFLDGQQAKMRLKGEVF